MSSNAGFNFGAFLDGATGAGLFGRKSWPGAPTCLIDPEEEIIAPVEEYKLGHEAMLEALTEAEEQGRAAVPDALAWTQGEAGFGIPGSKPRSVFLEGMLDIDLAAILRSRATLRDEEKALVEMAHELGGMIHVMGEGHLAGSSRDMASVVYEALEDVRRIGADLRVVESRLRDASIQISGTASPLSTAWKPAGLRK